MIPVHSSAPSGAASPQPYPEHPRSEYQHLYDILESVQFEERPQIKSASTINRALRRRDLPSPITAEERKAINRDLKRMAMVPKPKKQITKLSMEKLFSHFLITPQ